MALVLGVLILAVAATGSVLALSQDRSREATDVHDRLAATLLAEAGVNLYIGAINRGEVSHDALLAGTPPTRTYAGRTGTVTVTCDATGYPLALVVSSSATVRSRTIVIEAAARRAQRGTGGGGYGLGSRGNVGLDQDNLVDSYDSSKGSYQATQSDNARVGNASGAVTIGPGVVIRGDVSTGGSVTANSTAVITGGILTDDPPSFELVDQAVDDAIAAAQRANSNASLQQAIAASGNSWELTSAGVLRTKNHRSPPLVVPPGSYSLTGIQLGQGRQLIFSAGQTTIALVGDLTLEQDATLKVDEDVNVQLFAKGSVTLHQAFDPGFDPATTLLTPSQFQVFGHSTGGTLTVHQDSTLFGILNWPGRHVQLDLGSQVYGSVIGSTVQADQDVQIHFDGGGGGGTPDGPFRVTALRNSSILY